VSTNETNDGVNENLVDRPDEPEDLQGAATGEPGEAGEGRRRRRRRRRRGERAPEVVDAAAPVVSSPVAAAPAGDRPRRDWGARIRDVAEPAPLASAGAPPKAASNGPGSDSSTASASGTASGTAAADATPRSASTEGASGRRERARARREERARDRGRERGAERGRERARADGERARDGDRARAEGERERGRGDRTRTESARSAPVTREAPTPRLEARRPAPVPPDELDAELSTEVPAVAWGTDDDAPAPVVTLAADLPADAPADDPDPVTYPLLDAPPAQLGDDIASVVGVRFVPGGRIQWFDAGEHDYRPGERVLVDSDRGHRLATVATSPLRRAIRDRGLRRVVRRATEQDLRGERDGDADRAKALRIAKDAAAALRLPMKVFRVELNGPLGRGCKLNVYYTSDERLDLREFLRDVSSATGARIELRQLGVRDEAKAVGGIGSCGLTLCCTTWLPDFVPVSIKMAKDQGLVLSPTKVSGQCGRLKCCLVYEQAGYAELRKGLPKLGKRVISPRGEGRVVEVDVLRQRVRVSYGMGDTEVLPAGEVKPLFPSGNPPRGGAGAGAARGAAPDLAAELAEDGSEDDQGPTDDPSSDHFRGTDEASSDDYDA